MVKKILLGAAAVIALAVVVVLGLASRKPAEFQVSRSAEISAPPAVVFAQVNDFRKWEAWSPWAKMDPAAKNTFEGPAEGEGAKFAWAGNSKVGSGQMTIIESRAPELIRINLEFTKPFKATNLTEMAFRAVEGGTNMTWTMTGTNNLMGRAMCVFMDMDKMVGGDFEKGLASIKTIAESQAKG